MGNLASSVSEAELKKLFKPDGGGRLREVVIKDGFGFVEFERCCYKSYIIFFNKALAKHNGKGPVDLRR